MDFARQVRAQFARRSDIPAISPGTPDRPRWSARRIMRGEELQWWDQVYNPFNNTTLSTIAAAIPVVTLLVLIASGKVKAHIAAIVALVLANLVAILLFTMPANLAIRASLLGIVSGFLPDRLDRAERHFHVPAHGARRTV